MYTYTMRKSGVNVEELRVVLDAFHEDMVTTIMYMYMYMHMRTGTNQLVRVP